MNGREEKTSPLRLTWDLAMACRADVVYILREFSCLVIAALLFPDMEQDPAIVAGARRSNVQVLWATDKLMGRVAEIAAGKDCRLATLETSAPGGTPGGLRRRGGFPIPNDRQTGRVAGPNPYGPGSPDQRDQSPRDRRRPSPQIPISISP